MKRFLTLLALLSITIALVGCSAGNAGNSNPSRIKSKSMVSVTSYTGDGTYETSKESKKIKVIEQYTVRSERFGGKTVYAIVLKNNNDYGVVASFRTLKAYKKADDSEINFDSNEDPQINNDVFIGAGETNCLWQITDTGNGDLPGRYVVEISVRGYPDILNLGIQESHQVNGNNIAITIGNYGDYSISPFFTLLSFNDHGECINLDLYVPDIYLEPGSVALERYESDTAFSEVEVYIHCWPY